MAELIPEPLTQAQWQEKLHQRMKEKGLSPEKPIEWASQLCTALKLTYTGDDKIDLIKNAMWSWFNREEVRDLKPEDPQRHFTADQAIQVLQQGFVDGLVADRTVLKAISLRKNGTFVDKVQLRHEADGMPAPPEVKAPERKLAPVVRPEVVRDVAEEVETIGPKVLVQPKPPVADVSAIPEPPKDGPRAAKLGSR
jgi:hypothetical protein